MSTQKPNLIMVTQRLFYDDELFGYNVKLVEQLSRRCKKLYVLPLYGEPMTHLDAVEVHPFGDNSSEPRWRKVLRLFKIFYSISNNRLIDGFFIHQNEMYAPLLCWGKLLVDGPYVLFKAHGQLPWTISIALPFIDKVLTSAEEGFRYETPKKKIIGQSIDTDLFTPEPFPERPPFRIVSVGRISPIKGYDVLIKALEKVMEQSGSQFKLTIVGGPARPEDEEYLEDLKSLIENLALEEAVTFAGGQPYEKIPEYLANSHLFVNSTVEESALDKVVLEAMASGRPVITTNPSYEEVLKDFSNSITPWENPEELAGQILYWSNQKDEELKTTGKELRKLVTRHHSMQNFTENIIKQFI